MELKDLTESDKGKRVMYTGERNPQPARIISRGIDDTSKEFLVVKIERTLMEIKTIPENCTPLRESYPD